MFALLFRERNLFLILFLLSSFNSFGQLEGLRPLLKDFQNQSSPKMTKSDYYSLSGKYFNTSVLDKLPYWYNESQKIQLIDKLRPEIKGLYFWMYLDGQVSNGGFSQFFDNGFAYMIPEIKQFYFFVGDSLNLEILKKAENWYDEKQSEEAFLDFKLNSLDNEYFEHSDQSNQLIEAYIRTHSEFFITDEEGNLFPENFSGKIYSVDPNSSELKEFEVENNHIQGSMKIYSSEGIISKELTYRNGVQFGTQKEYDKEGRLHKQEIILFQPRVTETTYYFPNGQIEMSLTKDSLNTQFGETIYWHENGTLKRRFLLDSGGNHTSPYLEYYPNGKKKEEVDLREGNTRYINFWDREGNQLLINGTGFYFDDSEINYLGLYRYEYQFKNFLEDGVQKVFKNGILQSYKEMRNGKPEGYFREYYSNGKLKNEYLIEEGKILSHQKKPFFDHPKLNSEIETKVNEELFSQRGYHLTDTYPTLLNAEEVSQQILFPIEDFESYNWVTKLSCSYLLHISEEGKVIGNDFFYADNGRVSDAIEEIFPKLQFQPGMKNGRPITSYLWFKVNLWLTESQE
jgi:antitoxin component YwqK of YwqJK toxin-antitoxin module